MNNRPMTRGEKIWMVLVCLLVVGVVVGIARQSSPQCFKDPYQNGKEFCQDQDGNVGY